MLLTGKYEHSIDAKQRLAIPAKIRAGLDPKREGETFYVIEGPNGGIWLWPQRTFERMAGEIEETLAPATELMDFDEVTFPDARQVEIDSAGRIRLPEGMLAEAGISSRVVILGMRDHLEVWDPDRWETRRREKAAKRAEIVQRVRASLRGHHGEKA